MIGTIHIPSAIRDALLQSDLALMDLSEWGDRAARSVSLDALLVGSDVANPVQSASRAYRMDPGLSVVILGEDRRQCERIRAALRFSPMIGRDVTCVETRLQSMVDTVRAAASRGRAAARQNVGNQLTCVARAAHGCDPFVRGSMVNGFGSAATVRRSRADCRR
jgi:hypothetical protein